MNPIKCGKGIANRIIILLHCFTDYLVIECTDTIYGSPSRCNIQTTVHAHPTVNINRIYTIWIIYSNTNFTWNINSRRVCPASQYNLVRTSYFGIISNCCRMIIIIITAIIRTVTDISIIITIYITFSGRVTKGTIIFSKHVLR